MTERALAASLVAATNGTAAPCATVVVAAPRRSIALCIACVACVAATSACDQRRCAVDDDCVADERCTAGVCAVGTRGEGEGEGEGAPGEGEGAPGEGEGAPGEGEGAPGEGEGSPGEGEGEGATCSAGCAANQICVTASAAPEAGTCAPPGGTALECAGIQPGTDTPAPDGPAIWAVTSNEQGLCADVSLTDMRVTFRFFDPAGTSSLQIADVLAHVDVDSNNYFSASVSKADDDAAHPGVSGTATADICMPVDTTSFELVMSDDDANQSNTLCLHR